MTKALTGKEVAAKLGQQFAGSGIEASDAALRVNSGSLLPVATYLKTAEGLEFDYLNFVTAVDFIDYFEVVYYLSSLKNNHSLVMKVRANGRQNPTVPSVVGLWKSADLQEREIYDLMGVTFTGHPNLKRIVLWPEFNGYPLRKDYL